MKQSIYRHSNPSNLLCCLQFSWFLYILPIYHEILKRRKTTDDISLVSFFFLRSESKRLHITFGSHTMSYRTTQKWCQNEAKSTWKNLNMQISRGTCLQTPPPPPTSLYAHASAPALVLASSKLSESPYFPLKGVGMSVSIVSVKCLKKGFIESFLHL